MGASPRVSKAVKNPDDAFRLRQRQKAEQVKV